MLHHTDLTGFSKQAISTTIVGYDGTEVDYTPPQNSLNIVYEANYTIAWDPDPQGSYPSTRLQYSSDGGSTWTTLSGTRAMEGTFSSVNDNDWMQMTYRFVIAPWSGLRKLRLAGRAYSASAEYTVGRQFYSNYSEGVSACPNISVYAVVL